MNAVHTCAGIAETGLACEQIELTMPAGVTTYPPPLQWRLHVVSAGKRALLSLIVKFCPFCGEHLGGYTPDGRGVVLS